MTLLPYDPMTLLPYDPMTVLPYYPITLYPNPSLYEGFDEPEDRIPPWCHFVPWCCAVVVTGSCVLWKLDVVR